MCKNRRPSYNRSFNQNIEKCLGNKQKVKRLDAHSTPTKKAQSKYQKYKQKSYN